jgi:hypothetical protein
MRRGNDGFLGGTVRTSGPVKGAEDRVGSGTRVGGLSEGLPGTVVDFEHVGAQHLAPRNVVVGRRTEPGAKVFAGEMSIPLLVAAGLALLLGMAHSYLGERYIIVRLLRRADLPTLFGGAEFTKHTLRFAWHLTTIAWAGFAVLLAVLASPGGGAAHTQAGHRSHVRSQRRCGLRCVKGASPVLDRLLRHGRPDVVRVSVGTRLCHTPAVGLTDVEKAMQRSNTRCSRRPLMRF